VAWYVPNNLEYDIIPGDGDITSLIGEELPTGKGNNLVFSCRKSGKEGGYFYLILPNTRDDEEIKKYLQQTLCIKTS
jgi:hypothetical protein